MENTEVKEKCHCQEENHECKGGDNCQCHKEEKNNKKEKKDKTKKKIEELEEKITALEKEKEDLSNSVLLAKAELINYRKRKDEETSNLLKYASQDLISEIITVIDSFERALKIDNPSEELKSFLEGFKLVYANLCEILKKYGVTVIDRVGEEFDPNQEDALMVDTDESKEDDTVLEVLSKGYKLKDRVIRPASVKINKL